LALIKLKYLEEELTDKLSEASEPLSLLTINEHLQAALRNEEEAKFPETMRQL
jgi:hypothetical protein